MRWIVCGMLGVYLWGQGQDPLRDSLVVENERIEYLELGIKPHPSIPSFEIPKWDIRLTPTWEKSPSASVRLPEAPTPGRPTWARLDPVHLRYSLGRFWTQEGQLLWNKTRALSWDGGVRLHHRSNLQAFVPQARSGTTTLAGWGGYYTSLLTLEGRYEGSYQKYRLYAPYAEKWNGYDWAAPLPDSLQVAYFRQGLDFTLRMRRARTVLRYRTARMDFDTGVPEWLHFVEGGIDFRLPSPGEGGVNGEVFTDGKRYSFSARPRYGYHGVRWGVEMGLMVSYARDNRQMLLLSPVGEIVYKGWFSFLRPYMKAEAGMRPITYFDQVVRNPYLRRGGRF
jgi:hypothetical protein